MVANPDPQFTKVITKYLYQILSLIFKIGKKKKTGTNFNSSNPDKGFFEGMIRFSLTTGSGFFFSLSGVGSGSTTTRSAIL